MSMNVSMLLGRLTADPELRTTNSGISYTRITVAVDRARRTDDGEKQTDFIDCVAWRQQAEFISKYFRKGDPIAVMGAIHSGSFIDKQDVRHKTQEITVERVSFCGSKRNSAGGGSQPAPAPQRSQTRQRSAPPPPESDDPYDYDFYTDDDLPF